MSTIWIFLGPPGSGKGTQAALLAERSGWVHLSTGDLLRKAVREGSELGKKAKAYMDKGELVPDALLLDLVREKLHTEPKPKGWVLDGYPRNLAQAESLSRIIDEIPGVQIGGVLSLVVSTPELVTRLKKRAALENRTDDTDATVQNRLRVYEEQTAPVIDFYRQQLREVDGLGEIEEVQSRIGAIIEGGKGGGRYGKAATNGAHHSAPGRA
ncbi:MAG TPA: adenylate kinase [bacterium]|nr:adenylate kinase [bacterium]